MPGHTFKMDQTLPIDLLWIRVAPWSRLKLSHFEIAYGRPLQDSVLGIPPLDLEHESKIKKLYNIRASTNNFAQVCSLQLSTQLTSPYAHSTGDRIFLKTWKTQDPQQQLAKQWINTYDILLTTHSSLKLTGTKPRIHHT